MSGACARRVALLLALLVCAAPAARAQRVLARTAALSATRQAAALYMHSLDFGRGGALPGVNRLPGSSATAPLLLWESGRRCVAGSGPAHPPQRPEPGDPDTVISLARTAPFQLVEPAVYRSEPGWREWPANLRGNGDRCLLAVLGGLETPERGRLRLLSFDENGMAPVPVREWGLPGGAVGAVFTASAAAPGGLLPTVAVLCRGPTGAPPVLALCDPVSGRITRHSMVELPGWNPVCVEPDAIASPPNGAWVAVSLSGTDLDLGTGEPVSQVAFFDPVRRAWAGAPVRVQGVVGPEGLRFTARGACWAGSTVPGTDFAYMARMDLAGESWAKRAEFPLSGASEGFLFRTSPLGNGVAVALGRHLELWPDGARGTLRAEFQDTLGAMAWGTEGLFVGEASRVHRVDTVMGVSTGAVLLQSGRVTGLLPLSGEYLPHPDADVDGLTDAEELALGTRPDLPDTDGDGWPDGSDPDPLRPAPRLEAASAVLLRGEAAGSELRALRVGTGAVPAPWVVEHDAGSMPWLVMHPLSGRGAGVVYLGADPARLPAGAPAGGVVRIRLREPVSGSGPEQSPVGVQVRVLPVRERAARLLWAWPDGDGVDIPGTWGPRLAGPPLYFSQERADGPVSGDLSPYRLVAVHAAALQRGYFARQQLLDYLGGGGGLLVVGGAPETGRALAPWLAPLGMAVSAEAPPAGPQPVMAGTGPLRWWAGFDPGGQYGFVRADTAARLFARPLPAFYQVPESGFPPGTPAVLMARAYGHGRVAALSSDRIPAAAGRGDAKAARFMERLAAWLVRGPVETRDMDGDGLPDDLEDADGNGARDPGETDWLAADSDGDGVPDGMEDWNRNGMVDPGETDPRNPDSDGDGIWDGADPAPAPVYGAPHIASIEPSSGPAEGGTLVAVAGRGLDQGATLWFGDRQAAWTPTPGGVAALARVPESAGEGGDVEVRIESPGGGLRGILPGGYRYLARTRVPVRMEVDPASLKRAGDCVEGVLKIHATPPPGLTAIKFLLLLDLPKTEGFQWLEEGASGLGHVTKNSLGRIQVVGEMRARRGEPEILLGAVPWRLCPAAGAVKVSFDAVRGVAVESNGGRMPFEGAPLSVELPVPE
ncbi:MAG: IPT/TIG domain-containing protein [Candidatus Hydrogenedentes bacterium]|nr:IPT/TIG domain-containing protein [Candidatus Hydrogenedentota bacterium]